MNDLKWAVKLPVGVVSWSFGYLWRISPLVLLLAAARPDLSSTQVAIFFAVPSIFLLLLIKALVILIVVLFQAIGPEFFIDTAASQATTAPSVPASGPGVLRFEALFLGLAFIPSILVYVLLGESWAVVTGSILAVALISGSFAAMWFASRRALGPPRPERAKGPVGGVTLDGLIWALGALTGHQR